MKTSRQFFEDIASRRKMFKQRQAQQAADFKNRTVGAIQKAKEKAAYREKVKAEVRKEIENES